ncbi:MAG: hypothetical protein IJK45_04040 [Bacteroidaceae bacterium]|nr:hypothetical protein [Bacteroidaceae bacterium]
MKKFWKPLLFAAIGVFALSSCEDVPAPYEIPGGGGATPEPIEAIETTCAEAVELTNALGDGDTSTEVYSVTGYITEVVGEVSRNQQTFWMADTQNGGRIFEAYWANLPEGVDAFKAGTKVKVTGKLTKYVNANTGKVTAEMKNPTVEILEGGGDTPTGIEVTCAEAVDLTNALEDGATSAEVYTVTGYITEVVGSPSKNQQTFWMADEKGGGKVFEAYWANLPAGVDAFKVGMKVKITGSLMKYVKDGKVTPEIKNAAVEILEDGGDTPTPAGTEVTCAQAVDLTNALEDGATSSEVYTVTGYITEVLGTVSTKTGTPQQSFWMADTKDGGKVFEAYYANVPSGVSEFKAGMKVKITGNLMKYVKDGKVTPEIKNATVEILEDGGGDTPTPTGTDVTCAQAVDLTNALEDGATSAETYSVTGYITEVLGAVSTKTGTPQQSFWMADTKDGGKVFEAYYANVPSGVSEFKAGMKVKITGNLMKYVKDGKVTPEIKNATVEILEGGGNDGGSGGGGDTPEGDVTIAASGMGLANNTSWTTVTVNGVTFTADGGGNQNTPKYFDNGSNLRMYPKNSLTISAGKNIASIVLTCTSGSVANGNVGAEPGSVSVSDPTITISGINSKTVKISNNDGSTGAASQIRIESIAIKFAE